VIEVVSVTGLVTVQDAGRPGHMHEGVPPGGALVPEMLGRANAAAHNEPGEAAIEAMGAIAIVARGALLLGTDDGDARALRDGEGYALPGGRARVRYVAVRGGIDVPCVLGGRGTLVAVHFGGHEGRPLRRGDVLRIGATPRHDAPLPGRPDTDALVEVVLGPDLERFDPHTIEMFLGSIFTIDPRSDRVGTRLAGPRLICVPDPESPSAPMVRGAIQVPPSGAPIVLGPDHPTTGGYPVIATVRRGHLGSLSARPVGAPVRFVT
jgi:biotin-dependent carboxylase-like uncharacterized protein